jgi:hypothetical protein
MKNIIKYISIFLIGLITLSSCKKYEPDFHKVRFHILFKQIPQPGSSNMIDVVCSPDYDDEPPVLHKEVITPYYEWNYEYWELTDGDEVKFIVNPQLSYWFIMSVYVDGELVSTRECVTSSQTYYSTQTLNQSGLNNDENTNHPVISFYFYE